MTTSLAPYQPSAIERNPCAVYLASLSTKGRRGMESKLATVSRILGVEDPLAVNWADLRFQHLAAIRAKLGESDLAYSTVNVAIYAVRGVMKAAFNLGLIDADEYQRIRQVEPLRGYREPTGRHLRNTEVEKLIDAALEKGGAIGARDVALISVLYAGGLRRSEIVGLNIDDFDATSGQLLVRGKGNKERTLWLAGGALRAAEDWLKVRGNAEGPLFLPITRWGTIEVRPMTDQAVYNILRKLAHKAKIKRFSPHDMRRTFVSNLLDAGADIVTVQGMAGHASPSTTSRYDRRGDGAKRRAASLIVTPYKRKAKEEEDGDTNKPTTT